MLSPSSTSHPPISSAPFMCAPSYWITHLLCGLLEDIGTGVNIAFCYFKNLEKAKYKESKTSIKKRIKKFKAEDEEGVDLPQLPSSPPKASSASILRYPTWPWPFQKEAAVDVDEQASPIPNAAPISNAIPAQ